VGPPTDASAIRVLQCESKEPEEQLTAYAWVVELAEASWHLLYEFAKRCELGYFAQPSDDLDAATASRSVASKITHIRKPWSSP
jgi:hypothetical protein